MTINKLSVKLSNLLRFVGVFRGHRKLTIMSDGAEKKQKPEMTGEKTNKTVEDLMKDLSNTPTDCPKLPSSPPANSHVASETKFDGDRKVLDVEDWNKRWEDGRTGFHIGQKYHPKLVKFQDQLIQGRKGLKFFFPLCGKTHDMKWMYDEGHTVVGVEGSPKATEEFFLENDLTYVADVVDAVDGAVYKTEDDRLRIYNCDFFKFSPSVERDFTAVFDRGSLVAINKADRQRYADLIVSVLAPDARYMLLTFDYDASKYPGPPHYLSIEEIEGLYGEKCDLDLIDVEDAFEERNKAWGITSLDERIHIITPKQ